MDLSALTEQTDAQTVQDLRARGSVKWTAHPDAIGAFVAEMDFGLAPPIAAALHEATETGRTGYLPEGLTGELRTATAAWSAERYGWAIAPEQVQPMADVLTGLDVLLRHYSDPDAAVIVPTPAYMPFLVRPKALGRRIIEVPCPVVNGRYVLDLDGIARAFEQGGGVLVLCNPWNPVGRVLDTDELTAVAEVVDRYGGRVFADEVHGSLVFDGHRHVPYASLSDVAASHTLTATSASKAFNLPGLKCAQLILSNEADAARYEEIRGFVAHGASTFGVIANTSAYTDGGPWLDAALAHLDGNRRRFAELLGEQLPEVGHTMPEGTYIAWLDVRRLPIDGPPADFLLERAKVAVTDGTACGTPGFLRFILATPRPVLEDAVARIAAAVR